VTQNSTPSTFVLKLLERLRPVPDEKQLGGEPRGGVEEPSSGTPAGTLVSVFRPGRTPVAAGPRPYSDWVIPIRVIRPPGHGQQVRFRCEREPRRAA